MNARQTSVNLVKSIFFYNNKNGKSKAITNNNTILFPTDLQKTEENVDNI